MATSAKEIAMRQLDPVRTKNLVAAFRAKLAQERKGECGHVLDACDPPTARDDCAREQTDRALDKLVHYLAPEAL